MWLIRNELQCILRQKTFTSVAPNLTRSLPCLLWGVGCVSQFLGLLAKIGGLDPILLRVGEQGNGNKICPLPCNNRRIHDTCAEPTNTKEEADITSIRSLAGMIWAVATACSTEHD